MIKAYVKTNIYFIVPIGSWLALYGPMVVGLLHKKNAFSGGVAMLLVIAVVPYSILWIIASLFPTKAGICKVGSLAIFTITALLAIKFRFFTYGEEAMGVFFLPVIVLQVILYIILLLPFAAIIVYVRRRLRQKTDIENR
jgi:hypothetical protein